MALWLMLSSVLLHVNPQLTWVTPITITLDEHQAHVSCRQCTYWQHSTDNYVAEQVPVSYCQRHNLYHSCCRVAVGTFFLWLIWLFTEADMVFSCGRCGCGRYGLWSIWHRAQQGSVLTAFTVNVSHHSPWSDLIVYRIRDYYNYSIVHSR